MKISERIIVARILNKKTQQAIRNIQNLNLPDKPYFLGFSGGKDSIVLLDLTKKANVDFYPVYANTTIDPPGHIKFIKENYTEVKISHPNKSFYELVKHRGFPSRIRRFCCEELKEYTGVGKRNLLGMRRDEGSKRKYYEIEICDDRHKNTTIVLPMLNWTESDIWDYIKVNNLPYPKTYDKPYNFKRLGCVGCPLATTKQSIKEFRFFPRYARLMIKGIRYYIHNKPDTFLAQNINNEYEAFLWYLSHTSFRDFLKDRRRKSFFKPDAKKDLEFLLKIKLDK